jgi:hypothetical protein
VDHHRVLRELQTYLTSAGEVTIERTHYREVGKRRGRAVAALDVSIGVVAGSMTPQAARGGLPLVWLTRLALLSRSGAYAAGALVCTLVHVAHGVIVIPIPP